MIKESGFTLIELIVVISIMSIMLAISIPRLRGSILTDAKRESAQWLMLKTKSLKANAIQKHQNFILMISIDENKMWTINEGMDDEALIGAADGAYKLKEPVRIIDVEYTSGDKITNEIAEIYFYHNGYSDKVLIHLQNEEEYFTISIEPFLSIPKLYDEYKAYEN